MTGRGLIPACLIVTGLLTLFQGCQAPTGEARPGADTKAQSSLKKTSPEGSNMTIHYLEIVSNNVDALCAVYERMSTRFDVNSSSPPPRAVAGWGGRFTHLRAAMPHRSSPGEPSFLELRWPQPWLSGFTAPCRTQRP